MTPDKSTFTGVTATLIQELIKKDAAGHRPQLTALFPAGEKRVSFENGTEAAIILIMKMTGVDLNMAESMIMGLEVVWGKFE